VVSANTDVEDKTRAVTTIMSRWVGCIEHLPWEGGADRACVIVHLFYYTHR